MSKNSPKAPEPRPLVSNTSILILSAFLIGTVIGNAVEEDLSPFVMACGLSGFLAFIALELASERRTIDSRAAIDAEVSRRLDKHVVTPLAPPISLAFDGDPLADFFRETGLDRQASEKRTAVARS